MEVESVAALSHVGREGEKKTIRCGYWHGKKLFFWDDGLAGTAPQIRELGS